MTKKIFAEELKKDDVILIPASSYVGHRFYKVESVPELNDLTVTFLGCRMINKNRKDTFHKDEMKFGRKVELELVTE